MSGFAANTHSNIKQVMRTALVGVSPADQLMLKGYLRVLLRLEADLEWVPANHPQVDLLFINEEFKSTNSVQRLLSTNPAKPILFVKRDLDGQGGLRGDTLVIPLKELPTLNKWLMDKVLVLKANEANSALYESKRNKSKRVSDDTIKTAHAYKHSTEDDISVTLPISKPKPVRRTTTDLNGLIEFAKLVSQRPEGLFELLIDGKRRGIANLKSQKLWLDDTQVNFDKTWQLKPTIVPAPTNQSLDLFQWIWSKVWDSAHDMSYLVSDNQSFKLHYWPKPSKNQSRTDLLRVFTVLESQSLNVSEVANLTELSINTVKKAVIGLMLSGGLQQSIYTQLQLNASKPASANNHSATNISTQNSVGAHTQSTKIDNVEVDLKPVVSTGSALEDALQRRASGQSTPISATFEVNIDETQKQKPAEPQEKNEKRGFLSRLRKKLGL